MDAMAWLWAGALSLVAFWLGHRMGVDKSCRVFAALLIQFGLWDQYRAASERHERGAGVTSAEQAKERLLWCVSQRRNGGAWVEVGCEMIDVTFMFGDWTEHHLVPGLPNRYRWSYA